MGDTEDRRRIASASDAIDSLAGPAPTRGRAFVGKVVTAGSGPDQFQSVTRVGVSGDDSPGAVPDLDTSSTALIPVLVLGNPRMVGSLVLPRQVDGLWVARKLGPSADPDPCHGNPHSFALIDYCTGGGASGYTILGYWPTADRIFGPWLDNPGGGPIYGTYAYIVKDRCQYVPFLGACGPTVFYIGHARLTVTGGTQGTDYYLYSPPGGTPYYHGDPSAPYVPDLFDYCYGSYDPTSIFPIIVSIQDIRPGANGSSVNITLNCGDDRTYALGSPPP